MVRHSLKLHWQGFIAAIQFLTRFPVPITVPFQSAVLTRSVIYFPVAGLFIGCLTAAVAWGLTFILPPLPAAVIVLALWTALSGGLHMDGWMDTADGVLSHRSRERMLEIMKDSRVGAMGVLAAVLLLLLKTALLAELLQDENAGSLALLLLIIIPAWGRSWMAVAIAGWPAARQGEGMANLFNGVNYRWAALSLLVAVLISLMTLTTAGFDLKLTLLLVIAALVLTVLCGVLLAVWLYRKLGGLTGDTYGAMNEAIEAALLLAAVIWLYVF